MVGNTGRGQGRKEGGGGEGEGNILFQRETAVQQRTVWIVVAQWLHGQLDCDHKQCTRQTLSAAVVAMHEV